MISLLNPKITGRPNPTWVHLDESVVVNQLRIPAGYGSESFLDDAKNPKLGTNLPDTRTDGFYQVYSASHYGDTRGNQWHTHIIAVARGSKYLPISQAFAQAA